MDRGSFILRAAGRLTGARQAGLLLAALLAMPGTALAQAKPPKQTATTTAQASATVVSMLSLIKVNDLVFGRIVPTATAGTVTVLPSSVRSATGGVLLASGVTPQAALFAGLGSPYQLTLVNVTTGIATLTRIGGRDTMTMETITIGGTKYYEINMIPVHARFTDSTGMLKFQMGGTLRVNARQTPGTYAGTFTIVMAYE